MLKNYQKYKPVNSWQIIPQYQQYRQGAVSHGNVGRVVSIVTRPIRIPSHETAPVQVVPALIGHYLQRVYPIDELLLILQHVEGVQHVQCRHAEEDDGEALRVEDAHLAGQGVEDPREVLDVLLLVEITHVFVLIFAIICMQKVEEEFDITFI